MNISMMVYLAEYKKYGLKSAILALLLITIIRILYLNQIPIFFDEAQYWTWSQQLDFGYFSKPPIIAWLIAFTTFIFDNNDIFFVKLSAPILHFFTAIFVYLIADCVEDSQDSRLPFLSSITYALIPGVIVSSAFISSDAPLLLFWAMSLYFFIKATDQPANINHWLLLGISVGCGMMSKYTMVVFGLCALLYLLTYRRNILRHYQPYLSTIIALIIFLPNIIWNYNNDFVSFRHTNENVLESGAFSASLVQLIEFCGAQFLVAGPIIFTAILIAFSKFYKSKSQNIVIIIYTSLPLLIIAIIIAFTSGAQAHWAAPVYIGGVIIAVKLLIHSKSCSKWLKISLILHIIIALCFLNYKFIEKQIAGDFTFFKRPEIWHVAAQRVVDAANKYQHVVIATDERKSIATLTYIMRNSNREIAKFNISRKIQDYYDMQNDANDYLGKDFILLTRSDKKFTKYFINSQIIDQFSVHDKHFNIYLLQKFIQN